MEEMHVHALDYLSVLAAPQVVAHRAHRGVRVRGASALVRYLPKEYRSSTTLGVSAPMVSPNLVNPSAAFDNEERLRAISQQLLSVPILDRVVQEEKLASDRRRRTPRSGSCAGASASACPIRWPERANRGASTPSSCRMPTRIRRARSGSPIVSPESSSTRTRRAAPSGPRTRRRSSAHSFAPARRGWQISRRGCGRPRKRTWAGCPSRRRRTCRRCPASGSSSKPTRRRSGASRIACR